MKEYTEYITLSRQRHITNKLNNSKILGIIDDVTLEDMQHIHGKNVSYATFKIYDHMRNHIDGIIITSCFDRYDDQETLLNSYYLNSKETPLQILFHAQPIFFSDNTRTYFGAPTLRVKHIEVIEEEEDIIL